ncbi:MAG: hypothetical protein WC761_06270 [Candidatus Paceibacterota bacterium]|jgi:hypothetical protein
MRSQWFDKKEKAILLRKKNGHSIGYIENKLGIPRSTLSGWFKDIVLSEKQKSILESNWRAGLIEGRKKAVIWHNTQKETRLKLAGEQAESVLSKINFGDKSILDLALAMLYLGEGFKVSGTGMGNSDPLILKFFLNVLEKNYQIDRNQVHCELHLRADQNGQKMKEFWSKELNVPMERFVHTFFDKRTEGKSTYDHYKGVCVVNCGNVAIQRKLVYLSRNFCKKVIENMRG